MTTTVVNNLFPPQLATFQSAFLNDQDAVIYFALSPFNSASDIKSVHVSLVDQRTNENALKTSTGILVSALNLDPSTGMYYVTIPVTSINSGGKFNINQFYKVQIRFDCYETVNNIPLEDQALGYYLLSYQTYFSEWSTVCLIRAIEKPDIYLRKFDSEGGNQTLSFNRGIIPISGRVIFGEDLQSLETETLQSYKISVLSKSDNSVLYETKSIYTGDLIDPNVINYKLDLQILPNDITHDLILRFDAVTKNQYKFHKDYDFIIADFVQDDDFDPIIDVKLDNENGIATLSIFNERNVIGTLYVKRASSVDNFKIWESISTTKVNGQVNMEIVDNTIGSLIWYRYSLQLENSAGGFTQLKRTQKFFPQFYDAIISRKDTQLAIRYDFRISNFKPVVNRTKIDTLGGRYPKFAENAILNYKQFSISGYISTEGDYNQLFLNKEKYFSDNYLNYRVYHTQESLKDNARNDIPQDESDEYVTTTENDWLWEREFREEAVKWLNDGEPKLFRSMTEGVIPVMLTDISLTPNITLGRRIWEFSATAYEIANGHSLSVLESLGIIDIPKVDVITQGDGNIPGEDEDYVEVIKVGQLYQTSLADAKKNDIIANIIGPKMVEKYAGVLNNKKPDSFYLKSVKIQFHNEPNIFLPGDNGNLIEVIDPADNSYSDIQRQSMILGYTFDVSTDTGAGSQKIFVNNNGFYQLPEYLNITQISFPQINDIVTIDYIVIYKERASAGSIISGSSIQDTVIGQYSGVFNYNEFLGDKIRVKYNYVKTDEYYQKMLYWRGISLDVNPYSIAHIKYRGDNEYNDYIVGFTGILNLLKDHQIVDMCFKGIRMIETPIDRQKYLEEWEYTKITDDAEDNPQRNCVYNRDGKLQIYYHNKWYDFEENSDGTGNAHVPVEGMINYLGDIQRNIYS